MLSFLLYIASKYINYRLRSHVERLISCQAHGADHAEEVMMHTRKAILSRGLLSRPLLGMYRYLYILLVAAYLHDVDDEKLFPLTGENEYKNAEELASILLYPDEVRLVKKICKLVSFSKNQNTIPEHVPELQCIIGSENQSVYIQLLMLVRYADRLVSLGMDGVVRCYKYTRYTSKQPLYIESTPILGDVDSIYQEAVKRDGQYKNSRSDSMIDHFYDKLLLLGNFPIRNKYFDDQCKIRQQPLVDFLLWFHQKMNTDRVVTWDDVQSYL